MNPPTFNHVGLNCLNLDAIEAFYCRHFGFKRAREVRLGGDDRIVFIKRGDCYLELFKATGPNPHGVPFKDGPTWAGVRHIAFHVDDVDAALKELGNTVKITLGPFGFDDFIKGWRAVWVADPEGNVIELSQGYKDE